MKRFESLCCFRSKRKWKMSLNEYPINVTKESYNESIVITNEKLFSALKSKDWKEAKNLLDQFGGVNSTELTDGAPDLRTPLHFAAADAPIDFIQYLLDGGAMKSFRMESGDDVDKSGNSLHFPFEIATAHHRPSSLIDLLRFQIPISDSSIDAAESSVAKVIAEVACGLAERTRLAAPQVSNARLQWESRAANKLRPMLECAVSSDRKFYDSYVPVPGMYGGARVTVILNPFSVEVNSWIRICGGSERLHKINEEGKITEVKLENPM